VQEPLASQEDPQKVEVTLEDQQRINEFNRLNGKSHELKAMMEAKKVRIAVFKARSKDMLQCHAFADFVALLLAILSEIVGRPGGCQQ
jgi:hypothetical protein